MDKENFLSEYVPNYYEILDIWECFGDIMDNFDMELPEEIDYIPSDCRRNLTQYLEIEIADYVFGEDFRCKLEEYIFDEDWDEGCDIIEKNCISFNVDHIIQAIKDTAEANDIEIPEEKEYSVNDILADLNRNNLILKFIHAR